MKQSDRNDMAEAIGTLMNICVKYNTPISLDIAFKDLEKGRMVIKLLGDSNEVEWFTKLGRFSHEFRAVNMMSKWHE